MDSVTLGDSSVFLGGDTELTVSSKKLSLVLAFDPMFGITLKSFVNSSGERAVEYMPEKQVFMPFNRPDTYRRVPMKLDIHVFFFPHTIERNEIPEKEPSWTLVERNAEKTLYGGVEAVRAVFAVKNAKCKVTLNLIAYPGCSIIRYWFDIDSLLESDTVVALSPFKLRFRVDAPADVYRAYWFKGSAPAYEYGQRYERVMSYNDKVEIKSHMTAYYVPLFILGRDGAPADGLMFVMDYVSYWSLTIDKFFNELNCDFRIDDDEGRVTLPAHGTVSTPVMTAAAFSGDQDSLMTELYDWQYTYMWDYTSSAYYGKTRSQSSNYWVFCSRVLHEQFGYRLVGMDLLGIKNFMSIGFDIQWDDAGWSAYPGWPENSYNTVFHNNYEGPDHRLSTRYFRKNGIGRLLWFAGKPSPGLLDTKHGAWGEFEWRTDNLVNYSFDDERNFKKELKEYLDADPRRSFHTCSGGANYANTFDVQRYANFHYASDCGSGPNINYYFSIFDLPDRWGDIILGLGGEMIGNDGSSAMYGSGSEPLWYNPDHARSRLSLVPYTAPPTDRNVPLIREDVEIYRYLISEGVAGKWSYMFHPGVYGDNAIYYMQRTSRDRLRACIIIRRRPKSRVLVFPTGLVDDEQYVVSFQISDETYTRTGAELRRDGIALENVAPRELVYLNLRAPGRCAGTAVPAPERVYARAETNVGVRGTGIYWCADKNGTWTSYYEISRDGETIAQVAKARYYFDFEPGAGACGKYAVRAVGASGAAGEWVSAIVLPDGGTTYATLGDHSEKSPLNGWRGGTSKDLTEFVPMHWVAPAHSPSADHGGTPNQPGGIEGYWEGENNCAKLGRGWAQASETDFCIRTFTLPRDGKVRVCGRAMKEWYHSGYGSDVTACVMLNGETVVPFTALRRNDINGLSYCLELDVKAGDELRFVTGKCDAENNDHTHYEQNANVIGWNTAITYADEEKTAPDFTLSVNCGGGEVRDGTTVFRADCGFTGGEALKTDGEGVFASARVAGAGETVKYSFAVPDGLYALRLSFREHVYESASKRFIRLSVNGTEYEHELDIVHDVRGAGKPLYRVCNYVVPDGEGKINIVLTSTLGGVCLNAVEILPENDRTVHINCGGEDFVDWAAFVWNADSCFSGGEAVYDRCDELRQASPTLYDKELYFSGRKGRDFSYRIPVPNGLYSVQLKFAELEPVLEGQRTFDIYINGSCVRKNMDALAAAGEYPMSADVRFDGICPDGGFITVRIVSTGELDAVLRAIEID